jgi:hypothetical protein
LNRNKHVHTQPYSAMSASSLPLTAPMCTSPALATYPHKTDVHPSRGPYAGTSSAACACQAKPYPLLTFTIWPQTWIVSVADSCSVLPRAGKRSEMMKYSRILGPLSSSGGDAQGRGMSIGKPRASTNLRRSKIASDLHFRKGFLSPPTRSSLSNSP